MRVIENLRLRAALRYGIPFVLIPALVALSAVLFEGQRYLIISLGIAVLALLLFMTGFEKRNIGSRRMVITAIMTALAVFGRFIPLFKPITAICVMTAIYLGAEAGFLCGSLSVLISNIWFGQGPWTPFQMLGFGLIGLIAGYLSRVCSTASSRAWRTRSSWTSGRCCGTRAASTGGCMRRRCCRHCRSPRSTPCRMSCSC